MSDDTRQPADGQDPASDFVARLERLSRHALRSFPQDVRDEAFSRLLDRLAPTLCDDPRRLLQEFSQIPGRYVTALQNHALDILRHEGKHRRIKDGLKARLEAEGPAVSTDPHVAYFERQEELRDAALRHPSRTVFEVIKQVCSLSRDEAQTVIRRAKVSREHLKSNSEGN